MTINVLPTPPPGLAVQTRSLSGRTRHKVGGVIATLETSVPRAGLTYYSALINWDDGTVQGARLTKAGAHGFKVNASHKYFVPGSYMASLTVSDRLGNSLTQVFMVNIH